MLDSVIIMVDVIISLKAYFLFSFDLDIQGSISSVTQGGSDTGKSPPAYLHWCVVKGMSARAAS